MCVVTPADVSGIAQTLTPLSAAKSGPSSSQDDKGAASGTDAGASLNKDSGSSTVDTVSISDKSRQAITEVLKEEAKKKEADNSNSNEQSNESAAKVQFVYDLKGELSVRYMDSANRLIYQVPSELMQKLRETVLRSDVSVDTKA